MSRSISRLHGRAVAIAFAAALSSGTGAATQAAPSKTMAVAPRSAVAQRAVPGVDADIRLPRRTMPGVGGDSIPATSLPLLPEGTPPGGGRPIVAWEHGTTTPGQKACAPSRTPDLDGGPTRDGSKSDDAWQIGRFIDAGNAVVVPNLEGLGPDATSP